MGQELVNEDVTEPVEGVEDTATSEEDSSFYAQVVDAENDGEIEETVVEDVEEPVAEEETEVVSEEAEPQETSEVTEEETEEVTVEEETPQVEVEEVAQLTPEQIAENQRLQNEQYAANREGLEKQLEETLYNLDESDAELLITEPEKIIPKVAAKLHVEVLEAATQGILAALPNVIRQVQKQSVAREKVVDDFYSSWPELKEHHAEVERIAIMYKQLNPQKVGAELAQGIGTYASVMLGKQIPGVTDSQVDQKEDAPTSTPPPAPAGRSTRGNTASTPTVSDNEFTAMADLIDQGEY